MDALERKRDLAAARVDDVHALGVGPKGADDDAVAAAMHPEE
jgi:hypothetical protein